MPRKPSFDRDVLIDQARDLFWKQGWAGTSMKDLEKALKLKPGSFYAAFGSKGALFELALDRYAAAGAARLSALADEVGAFGALKHYPALLMDMTAAPARACMLSKTVLELKTQEAALAAKAEEHLQRMEALFEALFRRAQQNGDIGTGHDPTALARRYQSDLLGLRVSAERLGVDTDALAQDIAAGLDRLAD
ncbi:MAG: helix-turn-helix domain-containing protein [Pseudomonadota bacterium]